VEGKVEHTWDAAADEADEYRRTLSPVQLSRARIALNTVWGMEATGIEIMGVVLLAQLALKHPEVAGDVADMGRMWVQRMATAIRDAVPHEIWLEWMKVLDKPVPPAPRV
jgi:hypothetical protein